MPHFMIVLIPYINLLNLSWIIKCLFFEEYGAIKEIWFGIANGQILSMFDRVICM